ncbi:hypothetical protein ACFYPZ_30325 [Streptomyces sp. NPDC005506]|uniref:hypothetical protein n=1 Tax=unclassified Streptomyces TaxID=2593676 RepID=UPI0036AF3653
MSPLRHIAARADQQSHASYTRMVTRELVTGLALRLAADDEPDYDGIEVLAKLLEAHAHHIDVSTALIRMKTAEPANA